MARVRLSSYDDLTTANTQNNNYADTVSGNALATAKNYTDVELALGVSEAKSYADSLPGKATVLTTTIPTTGWSGGAVTVPVTGLKEPAAISPSTKVGAATWAVGGWFASIPTNGTLRVEGTPLPSESNVPVQIVMWGV